MVSTGLSSPLPPTATAACLDTCRLRLVRRNAFQITAAVSLLAPPPNPHLTHTPLSFSFTPRRLLWVLGGRPLERSLALPSVYPETSLLSGRD